ncbi:MAG: type VII toxin-antitoxin system MntA family adenylyltransferase antitoxin [Candidatus Bipolaricaulaceae bacterium]
MRGVEEIRRRAVPVLEKREEVLVAYLFGSAAEGRPHGKSDVDLAILVDQKAYEERGKTEPFGYEAALTAELMAALATDHVDIVLLHKAPPLLAHEVIAHGVLLFSRDEEARHAFEVATKLRYLDTKPLREIQRLYLYERTKRGEFSKLPNPW